MVVTVAQKTHTSSNVGVVPQKQVSLMLYRTGTVRASIFARERATRAGMMSDLTNTLDYPSAYLRPLSVRPAHAMCSEGTGMSATQ